MLSQNFLYKNISFSIPRRAQTVNYWLIKKNIPLTNPKQKPIKYPIQKNTSKKLEKIFLPFGDTPITPKEKISRRTYTLCHKLDAIVYAEATSVSKAAEYYGVNTSQIKRWKKQKDAILSKDNKMGKVVKRVRPKKLLHVETSEVEVIIDG